MEFSEKEIPVVFEEAHVNVVYEIVYLLIWVRGLKLMTDFRVLMSGYAECDRLPCSSNQTESVPA